jgi:hypothetical protein
MELLLQLGRYHDLVTLQRDYIRAAEEQGNVYTQHRLMSWMGNRAWLVRDDVAGAKSALANAAGSRASGTQVQLADYNELVSHTFIDLYEHASKAAWLRIDDGWPRARQFLRVQSIAIEATALRGGAALAARRELPKAYDIAGACAKRLAGLDSRFARLCAAQLRAAIAACRGERDTAVERLHAVARDADALGTRGIAMAARMRLGTLLDDATTQQQASEAETYFRAQGVVEPRRFANLLSPGLIDAV